MAHTLPLPAASTEPAGDWTLWAENLRRDGLSPLGRNFPGGALIVFGHDLRFLAAGGAGLAQVGLSRDALEGKSPAEAFGEATALGMKPAFRMALDGHEATIEIPHAGRVLSISLTAVTSEAGAVLGGMGFVQDVTRARRQEQQLRDSVEQFRLAFDNAPIGMAIVGLDGEFRQVNPALCALTGYEAEQLLRLRFQDITHRDDLDADLHLLGELVRGERSTYQIEKRYCKANGDHVWTVLSVAIVRTAVGHPLHFISQIQDISARKGSELELLAAHSFQQAVLAASPDIIHVHDVRTPTTLWTSRDLTQTLGHSLEGDSTGLETSSGYLLPAADSERFADAVGEACKAGDGEVVELRHQVQRPGGSLRWVSTRLTPFQNAPDGSVSHILGVSRDVTDLVAFEARLEHAALHDELTGLPNRRLINLRLAQALERADDPTKVVVLFCDLDGFKRVNDAHGHQIGDVLLRECATRLISATRSGDTVGRMGGDEFVVLLSVGESEDSGQLAAEVAERLIRSVGQPTIIGATEHVITASIGICIAESGSSPDDLLRDADTAMYQAKLNGRDGYALFVPALREDACSRDALVRHLRRSLADNTLSVHYQLIVDPVTGKVTEVEALLRIPGENGRLLDTAAAVRVAEQTGLMGAVGERVLRQACEQVAAWRRMPQHAELRVAVNLSATEIARPGLYDRVTGIVAACCMDLTALTLEITETVLLDAASGTLLDLRRLHAVGVGIAIDDFGTGYAGLRYLATLPVTEIKVDRSFTCGLPHDPVSSTIVRATVGLASELGMGCVVEGVETREQLDALPSAPGLRVQGYLFGRPEAAGVEPPRIR